MTVLALSALASTAAAGALLAGRLTPFNLGWPREGRHPLAERLTALRRASPGKARRLLGGLALSGVLIGAALAAYAAEPSESQPSLQPNFSAPPTFETLKAEQSQYLRIYAAWHHATYPHNPGLPGGGYPMSSASLRAALGSRYQAFEENDRQLSVLIQQRNPSAIADLDKLKRLVGE